jgi:hypothetical protein
MTKFICAALMFVALATGCSKPKPYIQPPAAAEYSRTLQFPNQNNVLKAQAYASTDRLESTAMVSEHKLKLFFTAPPKTDGSKGEAIVFELDAHALSKDIVREYNFTNTTGKIQNVRFTYQERNNSRDIWGSFIDKAMGVIFTGSLHITRYDPQHKIISGTYLIEAQGLIHDPTARNITNQIELINQCDLKITGSFQNIKVQ